MAKIPTDGIDAALAEITGVPRRQLSRRDRVLQEAARIVATEVLRKPDPNSLTQAFSPMVSSPDGGDGANSQNPSVIQEASSGSLLPASDESFEDDEEIIAREKEFQGFVSDRKQTLERIDKLLEGAEEGKRS